MHPKHPLPIILFALLFTSLAALPAHAMKFSLVGVAGSSEPEASPAVASYSGQFDFGGGALLELELVPAVGLEFGGLYLHRKYDAIDTVATVTTRYRMLQFPVVLKAYLAEVLSFGIGGYYAKYQGDMSKTSTNTLGSTATTTSFAAANHGDVDYGLVTSFGIYLPFSQSVRFMLEGRYNIGIKDNSTTTSELKYNDIQALAGLQFAF